MGKRLNDSSSVDEIDILIRSVNVSTRSNETKGDDLGIWVLFLKFIKEGDGASFSESSIVLSIKVLLTCSVESIVKPGLKCLLNPTVACMATVKSNLSVIRNISG